MKKRDLLLILALLFAALAFFGIGRAGQDTGKKVAVVTVDGEVVRRISLSDDGVYPIRQADGSVNVLAVENGEAWMKEANCRDGLCVRQGKTHSAAKSIVCLPHKVVVSIEQAEQDSGEPSDDVDIVI